MTPTKICVMMNEAYELLKPMSIPNINKAMELAIQTMPMSQLNLFLHQCRFTLMKKKSGAWA